MRFISAFWFTTILTLITATVVPGQDQDELIGYVVDQETGQPVPYASVGVPEQHRGISANMNGFFRLILPDNNRDHHLQISSIGYERKSIPLSQVLWGQEQRFILMPATTMLDEVVIVGESQSLDDLVKDVSKNRKVYLRSTPYLMNGFYREVLEIDGSYRGLTEAQGMLYLNGYNSAYKNNNKHLTYDLAQWKHIRRSNYPQETKYLEIAAMLKAKDYYLHDGPLQGRNLKKLMFSISDSTRYQERLVLIISFEPKKEYVNFIPYKGRMLVKEDDQALLSLEIETHGPEPYLRNQEGQENISTYFEISFFLFQGQYYLNRTLLNKSFRRDNHQYLWSTELIGAAFSDQSAMFLNYNQRLVLYSEMLNPVVNYDPAFWKEFSFAQGTDLQKKFDGETDLEKQFENNHHQRLTPLPDGFESYQQMANDRDALDFLMQW